MLLIPLGVILAILYFANRPGRSYSYAYATCSDAEETLRRRFVSGEIDEETYRRLRITIKSK
ncbi:hypothetical protein [Papillibacter cinnamivorans]|uniref:Short C-terminal domain-containing protein n=1 Tax=Papillibacter cinnamivorans DSM 12816 TaxID=1122930 RepID=A0A1W1YIH2_9FIRM|nr:hypothetical protein [Papillibacter cinnamivorans]SMC35906.1 hypothetical protein SAMN02745168_0443 [Papillibacter cinnamivorans DSM 12816]